MSPSEDAKNNAEIATAGPVALSRRFFLMAAPIGLAGCVTAGGGFDAGQYASLRDGSVTIPAMDMGGVDPRFMRQEVAFATREPRGTIIVNKGQRHLYFVLGNGRAMRYGIGVGREGLAFAGSGYIGRKATWPNWTPTQNMIRRDPRNARYAGGMPGGINNPLGARAMYLFRGNRDTMFRIHGTTEPRSIGQAMSSGCIRLFNHDIIDLYNRTPIGARVVVVS